MLSPNPNSRLSGTLPPEIWPQVEELYQAALEQAPETRLAWLAQACPDNDPLRGEVESLLAADRQAGDFLERHASEQFSVSLPKLFPAFDPGHQLGPYRLVREIGHGGMGTVYLAERTDGEFHQRVAIKLVRQGFESDFLLRRFRHEREILARLEHPNIARLLDGGATPEGVPYLAMEFVEGQPIDEYCRQRQLSLPARLALFRTVCNAVRYAHQTFVIHRDLKPGNILVTADGTPKLLDFGIAKLLDPENALAESTLTRQLPMTPEYASPEQTDGSLITTASDVYSLGVILYQLLTGQRPYEFKNRSAKEVADVIRHHEPANPSDAVRRARAGETGAGSPDKLRRALMGDLDNIVLKALRKEPAARYQSAEQLAEDVWRHLEGLPVAARTGTFSYRSAKFVKRHRTGLTAAALVLFSLFAGVITTIQQMQVARAEARKARTERTQAETQRLRAEQEQVRAETERQKAQENLRRAEVAQLRAEAALRQVRAAESRAEAEKDRAEKRFNEVRGLANALLFEFHDAIEKLPGSTPVRQKLIAKGMEYLDRLSREAGDEPTLNRELAAGYLKLGDLQGRPDRQSLGDTQGAQLSYQKALDILLRLSATDPDNLDIIREASVFSSRLAEIAAARGDEATAQQQFQRTLDFRQRVLAANPTNVRAQDGVALTYLVMGDKIKDPRQRLIYFRQALRLREEIAAQTPNDLTAQHDLWICYLRVGDALHNLNQVQAISSHRAALALAERLSQAEPNNTKALSKLRESHLRLAKTLARIGESEESVEQCAKGLAIAQQFVTLEPNNSEALHSLIDTYQWFGKRLTEVGRPTEALAQYRQGMTIATKIIEADPTNWLLRRDTCKLLQSAGELLMQRDEMTEAGQFIEQGLSLTEGLIAGDAKNLANQSLHWKSLYLRSVWFQRATRAEEALTEANRARALIEEIAKRNSASPEYQINLAKSLSQISAIYLNWPSSPSNAPQEQRQYAQLACDYARQGLRVVHGLIEQGGAVTDAQKQVEHTTRLLNRAEEKLAAFSASSEKTP